MGIAMEVVKTVALQVPELGKRIKEARQAAQSSGQKMTRIAADAGMSTQNWYRIEKERQKLPLGTLRLIEQVLGADFGVKFENSED